MNKQVEELRKELKKYWGAQAEVARKAKCSGEHVRQVLRGQASNPNVLRVAADVLLYFKKKGTTGDPQVAAALESVRQAVAA